MLVFPVGFMSGDMSGEAGVVAGNDAVRLWDGSNQSNNTWLYETSSIGNPVKMPSAGLISVWFKRESWSHEVRLVSTFQSYGDTRGMRISLTSGRGVVFSMSDVGGSIVALATTGDNAFINDDSWQHLLISWNPNIGGNIYRVRIYANDSLVANDTARHLGAIFFERGTFFINQRDASIATPMSLYDLIVTDGEQDITQTSIRRKFIDASLNPVALGTQGELPFGTQARLFYSGDFSSWRNNKGYLSNADLLTSNASNFTQESSTP